VHVAADVLGDFLDVLAVALRQDDGLDSGSVLEQFTMYAVRRRRSSVGVSPTRQPSLQPVVPARRESSGGGNEAAEVFDGKASKEVREHAGRNASER